MRLRWRRSVDDTLEDTPTTADEAEEELGKAKEALQEAKQKREDGKIIAGVLSDIRKQNHFKDIWNEGLRGG